MRPANVALEVAAPVALLPAALAGAVVGLVAGAVAGAAVAVVLAAILGGWCRLAGDRMALSGVRGRDADPTRDARLANLVEGLSIGAGLRQPRLRIVESDGLNAMAAGTAASRAVLGVTSALLAELDRIELEAVLAEQLLRIRRKDTLPATVLVATFGLGRGMALPADRDTVADLAAVQLTRYPPALASALEKIDSKGSRVGQVKPYCSHLWLADPHGRPGSERWRMPLKDRVEALREL